MRLIYTPEGGEPREWTFTPRKLLSPEAEAIEAVGGDRWESWEEFGRLFQKGNLRAKRAALWIMLKREQPTLKFAHLVVGVTEIKVAYDEDDKAMMRREVLATPGLTDAERAELLKSLDAVEPEESEGPKDPEPSPLSEPGTDST